MKAMPLGQLLIILTIISISIGIWLLFFLKKKQIQQLHAQQVLSLSEAFATNKRQVFTRQKGLDRYNFLNYNLSEALIIQSEINV